MKAFFMGILTLILTANSPAQELLTLDRAVSLALEQNHVLRGATHDVEAAHWGQRNAISYFLPKVEISSDYTRIDPETDRRANAAVDFIKASAGTLGIPPSMLADLRPFAYRNAYTTSLTVVQPIYNGGAEIVGVKAADAAMDKSEYSFQDAEQAIIARVKSAYFEVLKADALVSLAKESAERTNRWLEMTRRRASLGSRTNTDVLRFQVQLASDEGNVVNAENYLAAARLNLNELLGEDLNKSFRLQEIVSVDSMISSNTSATPVFQFASFHMPVETSTLSESFLDAHPSMKVMDANLHLADINVSKSWVNFKPRVNLAFQYGWEKNNTLRLDGIRPWAFSLSVSLPIFNGFGDYTNLQRAEAEYDRTKEQVESFRRGLLLQATNAQLKLKSTGKRIDIAKIGLQQGLDVLNSVSRRYDAGAASNVDLIDAQTAYTSAKTNYITAVYDNYIADVELARAMGTISR